MTESEHAALAEYVRGLQWGPWRIVVIEENVQAAVGTRSVYIPDALPVMRVRLVTHLLDDGVLRTDGLHIWRVHE